MVVLLAALTLFAGCAGPGESGDGSQLQEQAQNTEEIRQQAGPGRNRGIQDPGAVQGMNGTGRQMLPGGQGMMPSEAVDSCAGKTEGESCGYVRDEETVTGTCRSVMDGQIVCFSGDMDQMRNRTRMPVDGTSACEGRSEGDQCTISMGEETLEGSCIDRDGEIVCMPDRSGFQRPEGTAPQDMN